MLDKLRMVQDILNGEEAEQFKNEAFGQYLSGAVTLTSILRSSINPEK